MPPNHQCKQLIPPVPVEYSGKWIAWDSTHMQILASHPDFLELWNLMQQMQVTDAVFVKNSSR